MRKRFTIHLVILILCLVLSTLATIRSAAANSNYFSVRIPSSSEEARHVWTLLNKIAFYNNNNYRISLPQSNVIHDLLDKANRKQLTRSDLRVLSRDFDEKIYHRSDYLNSYEIIQKSLPSANDKIKVFQTYRDKWNFYIPDQYKILLTLYGTGGSYNHLNGTITILIKKEGRFKRGPNPLATILHEAVHIGIEKPIVEKYRLSHWTKERIVDQFMAHHFRDVCPDYKMQPNAETEIDVIFKNEDVWDNLPKKIEEFLSQKNK